MVLHVTHIINLPVNHEHNVKCTIMKQQFQVGSQHEKKKKEYT